MAAKGRAIHGKQRVASSTQHAENSKQQAASSKKQAESRKQKAENSKQRTVANILSSHNPKVAPPPPIAIESGAFRTASFIILNTKLLVFDTEFLVF